MLSAVWDVKTGSSDLCYLYTQHRTQYVLQTEVKKKERLIWTGRRRDLKLLRKTKRTILSRRTGLANYQIRCLEKASGKGRSAHKFSLDSTSSVKGKELKGIGHNREQKLEANRIAKESVLGKDLLLEGLCKKDGGITTICTQYSQYKSLSRGSEGLYTRIVKENGTEIWEEKTRGQQRLICWRYYDACRVHCLNLESVDVYMLIERKYPLPLSVQSYLDKKLQGRKTDEIATNFENDREASWHQKVLRFDELDI
ncbi:hypothetical protein Tco_1102775 [Tanacetum coccineum]